MSSGSLVDLLEEALGHLLRMPFSAEEKRRQAELEVEYAEELRKIRIWHNVLSLLSLAAFPVLFWATARWWALRLAEKPAVFLHAGALNVSIPLLAAGALAASALIPGIIEERFGFHKGQRLKAIYRRAGEIKYGYLAPLIFGRAGLLAALIVLVSAAYGWSRYTVVTAQSLDLPAGAFTFKRETIPTSEVARLVTVRTTRANGKRTGPTDLVFLKNGRILSSISTLGEATGELAGGWARTSRSALDLLSGATGLEVEEVGLEERQTLEQYDQERKHIAAPPRVQLHGTAGDG